MRTLVAVQPPRLAAPEDIAVAYDEIVLISERLERFGAAVESEIGKINPELTDAAQAKQITALRTQFAAETAPLVARLAGLRDALVQDADV